MKRELLTVMGEFMNILAELPDDLEENKLINDAKLHIIFATDNLKIIKRSLADGNVRNV